MRWAILPLRRYFDFSGRSRRLEYWSFTLFLVLVYVALVVIATTLGFASARSETGPANPIALISSMGAIAVVMTIFWLATLIPSIAVAVRRLHDTNRSGWWLLAYIVPYVISTAISIAAARGNSPALAIVGMLLSLLGFVAAIALLVFLFLPGTNGMNRFGTDPKRPGSDLTEVFG